MSAPPNRTADRRTSAQPRRQMRSRKMRHSRRQWPTNLGGKISHTEADSSRGPVNFGAMPYEAKTGTPPTSYIRHTKKFRAEGDRSARNREPRIASTLARAFRTPFQSRNSGRQNFESPEAPSADTERTGAKTRGLLCLTVKRRHQHVCRNAAAQIFCPRNTPKTRKPISLSCLFVCFVDNSCCGLVRGCAALAKSHAVRERFPCEIETTERWRDLSSRRFEPVALTLTDWGQSAPP